MRYASFYTPFDTGKMKNSIISWTIFLCMILDITFYGALGNVGGHALFASLSQLKDLWINDVNIVQMLSRMVRKCQNPPTSITM